MLINIICGVFVIAAIAAICCIQHILTGPHHVPDRRTHPVVLAGLLFKDRLSGFVKRDH